LIAAKLYQLAGVHTLTYVPVEGGQHVATVLQTLGKNNVSQLGTFERQTAQKDFAVHAWLANWDAVGTGGDNVGVTMGGHVTTLDTGGSLKYRAQGEPKGAAFGDKVTEIDTLRDPSKSPDAAALYGEMTNAQIKESMARVISIPDEKITETVIKNGGTYDLAEKLIDRKIDLYEQLGMVPKPVAEELPSYMAPIPPAEEPKTFATKMEHAKHLLMKGTTSEELKSKLNWPAIGVPKTAHSLNLNLEKVKLPGGKFKYIGTPMTPEQVKNKGAYIAVPVKEITQAEASNKELSNKAASLGVAVVPKETLIAGLKASSEHDISTPAGNFKASLEAQGIKYKVDPTWNGEFIDLTNASDLSKVSNEILKWHPKVQKLTNSKYYIEDPAKTGEFIANVQATKEEAKAAEIAKKYATFVESKATGTPLENFKTALKNNGIDYMEYDKPAHTHIVVNYSEGAKVADLVSKYHPVFKQADEDDL
jgi:hypothetical protein